MEDPFRILGLPRQFDLTPAEVTTAHLRAVSRLHPDRATDEVQRVQMVQEAAAVGAAKQRVAHDLTRAEELLKLLGARSFLSAPLAPEFLFETLEWRDAIEDACSHSDGAGRAELTVRIRLRRAEELATLAGAFRIAMPLAQSGLPESPSSYGDVPPSPDSQGTPALMSSDLRAALRDAAAAVVRLRYLDRMLDRLTGDP
jgi:DnaJ-domain-containing protein 1